MLTLYILFCICPTALSTQNTYLILNRILQLKKSMDIFPVLEYLWRSNKIYWKKNMQVRIDTKPNHFGRTSAPLVKVNSTYIKHKVWPRQPIECLLYQPKVRAIQYKQGPERLTRLVNSNVLRLPEFRHLN